MKYDENGFRGATPTGNLDQRSGTASGSNPSRTPPPDAAIDPNGVTGDPSGIAIELTIPGAHKSGSSLVPGQNDGGLPGAGDLASNTTTGAGQGHGDAWDRYDWQSKPQQQGG